MNLRKALFSMSGMFFCWIIVSCSPKVPPPSALEVVPNEHQLEWQDMEYYMFIHFGPNTFTNVEWGDGKEDPKVFNPTDLDTRQWASIAKDAGMKGIIITAKHHDGFCLWPSAYSTHTVRESPWKDGKGDVLKELSESCKEFGLKFGVYLSPWDQNHPAYGTAEYNQVFANTLEEVLTSYGDVYEQWFDGANGGNLKHKYDWDLFHRVVYKHQPQAIIFSDIGPDCRWIGNERGFAGETNWSRLNVKGFTPGVGAPDPSILNQGQADGEAWVPGEVDVSIRPGWFYSPTTDEKVKSVERLMDIYYTSVGRNANLLLNVPPDRRGKIHPTDSTRLMEFRAAREVALKTNLAAGAKATATNTRGNASEYSIANLLDGNKATYWATDDDATTASIEVEFKEAITFNRVLLQEHLALGQRVAEFDIEVWSEQDNKWINLINATTIGHKRILLTRTIAAKKIKINITKSLAAIVLSNLEVYNAPDITMANVDGEKNKGEMVSKEWLSADKISTAKNDEGVDVKTTPKDNPLVVKLDKEYSIDGFSFTPNETGRGATIQRYNFYTSIDGKEWKKVKTNEIFNNIKNNPIRQDAIFNHSERAAFIKLEPIQLTVENATEYTFVDMNIILK